MFSTRLPLSITPLKPGTSDAKFNYDSPTTPPNRPPSMFHFSFFSIVNRGFTQSLRFTYSIVRKSMFRTLMPRFLLHWLQLQYYEVSRHCYHSPLTPSPNILLTVTVRMQSVLS